MRQEHEAPAPAPVTAGIDVTSKGTHETAI
jgi:hypothetical protein